MNHFARGRSKQGLATADVIARVLAAMNRHDAESVAGFFATDYRSEQPLHPNRGSGGSEQVLANWTSVFEGHGRSVGPDAPTR